MLQNPHIGCIHADRHGSSKAGLPHQFGQFIEAMRASEKVGPRPRGAYGDPAGVGHGPSSECSLGGNPAWANPTLHLASGVATKLSEVNKPFLRVFRGAWLPPSTHSIQNIAKKFKRMERGYTHNEWKKMANDTILKYGCTRHPRSPKTEWHTACRAEHLEANTLPPAPSPTFPAGEEWGESMPKMECRRT